MLVMVRYTDENYDLVEDYCLDYLIVTGRIVGHSADGKWKKVDTDYVKRDRDFSGKRMPGGF